MMKTLEQLLEERILILDGAMGTMIQRYQLDEDGYRGERFKDWPCDLKGNNDLLSLAQPQIIRDIKLELRDLDDVLGVDVDLVWSPLWHPSMMSEDAKDELGYDEEFGMGFGFH